MDLIDRKILSALDFDCRAPLSRIAKNLRVGRNVVDYRIRKLEEEGIIQKYISTINLGLLGYRTYRVYFKVHQSQSQDAFVDFLMDDSRVLHFLRTEGYFDYTISVAVKSINDLDNFLTGLRSKFKDLIRDTHISILVYTKIFKLHKLLLGKEEDSVKVRRFSGSEEKVEIDEKDKSILRELSQSANANIVDLSKKTGLSIDVIKYRLKHLNKNVIVSNRVILDLSKMGYYHYVVMLKMRQITKSDEAKLDSWCTKKGNVIYFGKRIGDFDFELNVAIKNIDDLNNFFSDLKKDFSGLIDSYELIINTELLKLNYLPF